MDDTIYVVYFNGKRYKKDGLKIAYLTEGAAKQIITTEAKYKAECEYDDMHKKEYKYWYDLSKEQRKELVEKMKERFEIVPYKPSL